MAVNKNAVSSFEVIRWSGYGYLGLLVVMLPWLIRIHDIYSLSKEIILIIVLQSVFAAAAEIDRLKPPSANFLADISQIFNLQASFTGATFVLSHVGPLISLWVTDCVWGMKLSGVCKRMRARLLYCLKLRNRPPPPGPLKGGGQKQGTDEGYETDDTADSDWSYEKVKGVPEVMESFKDFAKRALCDESLLFLEDVELYESDNTLWSEAGDEEAEGVIADVNSSDINERRLLACEKICDLYIRSDSCYEVNIESEMRCTILGMLAPEVFNALEVSEQRSVFERPYTEIRSLLQINLMYKFLKTSEFKQSHKRSLTHI
ncbi:unnamed protein product [Chrysoparadoxa australica]